MAALMGIPDLWGDEINADVLPPLVVLKLQAQKLHQRTQGLLTARVHTVTTSSTNENCHKMELHSPTINCTEPILEVRHQVLVPYPVSIYILEPIEWDDGTKSKEQLYLNASVLIQKLRIALQSPPIRSAIDSLLAMSNEQRSGYTTPDTEVTPQGT